MSQLDPDPRPRHRPLARSRAEARRGRNFRVPGWVSLLLAQPEGSPRRRDGRLRRDHRADRAADLGRRPERLQPARRAWRGALVGPPVRNDRPGQRHLLPGRRGRTPLACCSVSLAAVLATGLAAVLGITAALRRRALRRRRERPDQRLPRHSAHPAPRGHVRLYRGHGDGDDGHRPRGSSSGRSRRGSCGRRRCR